MFQHDSLSPNFERFPFVVFNFFLSYLFLKHNQMFQHDSLSPNFERLPFVVFNFFLSYLFLSHYILFYLVLSCTLF